MATPNETSTLSGNGELPSPKRKSTRKASGSPSSRIPPAPAAKRTIRRASSAPTETLFTLAADPSRTPVPPFIWIDYPLQGEILTAPTYVMRLGVGGADLVEISIDKSPWLPCRLTSGYWWYDWSAFAKGKHQLIARMRTPDGRWFKTPPRVCDYKSE